MIASKIQVLTATDGWWKYIGILSLIGTWFVCKDRELVPWNGRFSKVLEWE